MCGRINPNPSPSPLLVVPSSPLIPLLPTPLKSPSSIPLKRLSPEELASRRERDLCFNCDEKFHHGHKCSSRVFILIDEDHEGPQEDTLEMDPSPEPHDTHTRHQPKLVSIHSRVIWSLRYYACWAISTRTRNHWCNNWASPLAQLFL